MKTATAFLAAALVATMSERITPDAAGAALADAPEPSEQAQEPPTPHADLKALDRLVGRWRVSGGAQGEVSYQWTEGGFFLVQHVDVELYGQRIKGIEVIGHLRPFGGEPSAEIRSRSYDNFGNTLDYVYELDGDTLTIWGGERGSPAYYQGRFSDGGDTLTGAWVYPGGGGYESTATRIH